MTPLTEPRRDAAQNVTKEAHEDAVFRLQVYKDWFLKEIMRIGQRNTLIVLPITAQQVDYRDVPPG